MAAPNLVNPSSIIGKTAHVVAPSGSIGNVLSNSVANHVFKINSIFCANIVDTGAVDISIAIYDGVNTRYLAKTITVPIDATQIISTKDTYFYLEEGHIIRALAGAADSIDIIIGYEDITL